MSAEGALEFTNLEDKGRGVPLMRGVPARQSLRDGPRLIPSSDGRAGRNLPVSSGDKEIERVV